MQYLVANTRRCDPSAEAGSLPDYLELLNHLLETPPNDICRWDIALLNLICAPALPGSENLDIRKCLARLTNLTRFVQAQTERSLHRFRAHPVYGGSEPKWRMAMLVTLVKRDFGASYHPVARDDLLAGVEAPHTDSRESFIHGLLDDDPNRRWGTCASIPVLITAVARRLGYPVCLAVTLRHCYARWEGRETFNIEASNPMGMTVESDENYSAVGGGLTAEQEKSGYYLRRLTPAEEFADFMKQRVCILRDMARYEETFLWSARAMQFAPDDPVFPCAAYRIAEIALMHRFRMRHPTGRIPPVDSDEVFKCDLGELLAREERPLLLAIMAHYHESRGELDVARRFYEDACRRNIHGNNEQRDLQRFLRKYDLGRRSSPLMRPQDIGDRWH